MPRPPIRNDPLSPRFMRNVTGMLSWKQGAVVAWGMAPAATVRPSQRNGDRIRIPLSAT
jgi:hypothetical protein